MDMDIRKLRAEALYSIDEKSNVRKSHKNPVIEKVYKEYLEKPGSHKAHELLHTHYEKKEKYFPTITRAKSMVEQYAEERLFDRDGSNGAQFSLRNNFKGWDADKKNDDSGDGKITIVNNIPRPEKQNE